MDASPVDFTTALEMFRAGRAEQAMLACRRVVEDEPRCAAAHHLLAVLRLQSGDPAAALSSAERAVSIDPEHWTHHSTLGCILNELDRSDEAVVSYRRGLQVAPHTAEIYNNLARAQCDLGDIEASQASYREALRLDPTYAEAMYNLGNLCRDGGRMDEAIELFDAALRTRGEFPLASRNRGLALLEMGRFADGWAEYDWRWREEERTRPGSSLARAPWNGEPLAGRTILIHAEQGVGDEIMFASCYPQMIAKAARCVLTCDPRLAKLFGRSFPSALVLPVRRGEEPDWQPPPEMSLDYQIAAGDLPRRLRPCEESFPRQRRYLSASATLRESWRERLASLGSGLTIGISWQAGQTREEQRKRSIPLERWQSLLRTPGAQFVNLQYGDVDEQLAHVAATSGVTIHAFSDFDPTHDLDGLAAAISALDLVISVGNTTVHLAGSLGTPVWALLPLAGTWRWTQGQAGALWYRSVRLFRQPAPGDWDGLLERVSLELGKRTSEGEKERGGEGGRERGKEGRRERGTEVLLR